MSYGECLGAMILLIATSAFLCGCIAPPSDENTVSGTGTVAYIDLEGGFYGIEAADGTRYYPLNLGEDFQVDGISVEFSGIPREDVATIVQWGTPLELTSIRSIGDTNAGGDRDTMDKSRQVAEDHVKGMKEYMQYGGQNLQLIDTITLPYPDSWQFVFEFDMTSLKDPDVVDHAVMGVTVQDGKVTDVYLSAGLPGDIMTVGELAADPVYETPVTLIGRVSLLGQLNCPCFNLTSGGESVEVWYDLMVEDDKTELPPVSVEGIENGDIVLVEGTLKNSGTYHHKGVFWAQNISKYP